MCGERNHHPGAIAERVFPALGMLGHAPNTFRNVLADEDGRLRRLRVLAPCQLAPGNGSLRRRRAPRKHVSEGICQRRLTLRARDSGIRSRCYRTGFGSADDAGAPAHLLACVRAAGRDRDALPATALDRGCFAGRLGSGPRRVEWRRVPLRLAPPGLGGVQLSLRRGLGRRRSGSGSASLFSSGSWYVQGWGSVSGWSVTVQGLPSRR